MKRNITFDMDGTIANLYQVEGWLEDLHNEQTRPYDIAPLLCDAYELYLVLQTLDSIGVQLSVISWTSKNGTQAYNKQVKQSKIEWLKHAGIYDCFQEIHIVKYNTPKHTILKERKGILIDDDDSVRLKWEKYGGIAFNPADDIIDLLWRLVEEFEYEV